MHAAVFEAGWDSEGLLSRHRAVITGAHRGRGLEVIDLDCIYVHPDRGPESYAAKRTYDHVEGRMSTYQTLVTAVVVNADRIDGLAVDVQFPNYPSEALDYLNMTAQDHYPDLDSARQRFIDLLPYHQHRLSYRNRTNIAVAIVRQLEAEGHFPPVPDAFANGVLSLPLTPLIEPQGKHGVAARESARLMQGHGPWRRVDAGAAELGQPHPASFRPLTVARRNGEQKAFWVFSKTVRWKRYGRNRLGMVHEPAERQEQPRLLLTDARHGEGGRVARVWSYRWPVEVFPAFCKPAVGLEASQVRKEEAVKRHFRLRSVAQSLLQCTPAGGRTSARFAFAEDHQQTIGQKLYTLTREALGQVLQLVQGLFAQGQSYEYVLERLMPA